MNLSDFFGNGWDDPRTGQIMGLAQGLLSGRGSAGLAAGIQGMQQARQDDLRSQLARLQIRGAERQDREAQREADLQQAMRDAARQSFLPAEAGPGASVMRGPYVPGTSAEISQSPHLQGAPVETSRSPLQAGPTSPAPGRFDMSGYVQRLYALDPMKALAIQQAMAKESQINKLDPKDFTPASLARFAQTRNYGDLVRLDKLHFQDTGGKVAALDPFTGRPVAQVDKTGNPFDDLVLSDGAGGFTPNQALVDARKAIAKSGAANTSVKIENKLGEGIAGQVGPMLRESSTAAEGAAKQLDAANRIIKAVDANKMYAGTGANIGLTAAQLAETLGVAGQNTREKIENTRTAMQGLAQLTLAGRAQMRGQGAITESESKLAERAISGDISMTPAEIKQLANAASRSARYTTAEHQRKLDHVRKNPDLAGMTPFYDVAPVPEEAPAVARPNFRFENGRLVPVN